MTRAKYRLPVRPSPSGIGEVLPPYFADRTITAAHWQAEMLPQVPTDIEPYIIDVVLAPSAGVLSCEATFAPKSPDAGFHRGSVEYLTRARHQADVAYVHAPYCLEMIDHFLAPACGKSRRWYLTQHPWEYLGRESERDWRVRVRKVAGPAPDVRQMGQLINGLSFEAPLFGPGTLWVDYHR